MAIHKDLEKILITGEEIQRRVRELGEQITRDFQGEEVLLVGILKGAVIFFADLARQIPGSLFFDSFEEIENSLRATARPGDVILTVGAGNVYKIGEDIVE